MDLISSELGGYDFSIGNPIIAMQLPLKQGLEKQFIMNNAKLIKNQRLSGLVFGFFVSEG